MKKITILMLHLQHGGIEKQTTLFANELAKKYNVEIISVYSMNKDPAYELNKKIKVKYLIKGAPNREEFKKQLKSFHIFRTFKEGKKSIKILKDKKQLMIEEIKNLDCDYVLSTRIEFAELLSKYAPKDVITMTQEHLHNDSKSYVKRVKKAFANLDYLVVLSPWSKENYSKWLKGNKKIKIVEIPNIVDKLSKDKTKLNNNTIIAVGRMHKVKCFTDLIKVYKKVQKEIPDLKLNLVGDGDEYKKLKQLTKNLDVYMPGMVNSDEVNSYMKESSLYVMTSLTECFPMVLLEASSMGLPSVSFDVPTGPRAIIENGKSGYLIKDRNIDEMAKKIILLLNNKDKLKEFGNCAYENSKKYLKQEIMKKWFELFDLHQ